MKMLSVLSLNSENGMYVPYRIRSVARSRSVRVRVTGRGEVLVTKPRRVPKVFAEAFMRRHTQWIREHVEKVREAAAKRPPLSYDAATKARALKLVTERVRYFNREYGFVVGTIRIRNQTTRWGSCSRGGNLSFNYRIVALSPEAADYLVVHELCHIGEPNHSRRFWAFVEKTIPDYACLRRELRGMPIG